MKLSDLIKHVVKVNNATEEYNKSLYSYQKGLDLTLSIYSKMVAGESIKNGGVLEKIIAAGVLYTSPKYLPVVNSGCLLVNRAFLIKRVGFKQAVIQELKYSFISAGIGYGYYAFQENLNERSGASER